MSAERNEVISRQREQLGRRTPFVALLGGYTRIVTTPEGPRGVDFEAIEDVVAVTDALREATSSRLGPLAYATDTDHVVFRPGTVMRREPRASTTAGEIRDAMRTRRRGEPLTVGQPAVRRFPL